MSLALVKRYAELRLVAEAGATRAVGRDYTVKDGPLLLGLGPAAGYLSTLVLALYVQGDSVGLLYSAPGMLWALIPLLVFWISRLWLLAHRAELPDDPLVFTSNDGVSYGVAALALLVFVAASLL